MDVRVSNSYFNKLAIAEFCSTFFAIFGLFLSMILYELRVGVDSETVEHQLAREIAQFCNLCCCARPHADVISWGGLPNLDWLALRKLVWKQALRPLAGRMGRG